MYILKFVSVNFMFSLLLIFDYLYPAGSMLYVILTLLCLTLIVHNFAKEG